MDLALLVYAISLLPSLSSFFVSLVAGLGLVSIGMLFYLGDAGYRSYYNEAENAAHADTATKCKKWLWRNLWLSLTFCLVLVFLPKEKTAYMMVGAYTAQKIAQDPKVEQVGAKVLTIINQKLDSYVDEGIEEAEKTIEKKLSKKASK